MSAVFDVGDPVTWSSQAGGRTTNKVGNVVAVIPAGGRVLDVCRSLGVEAPRAEYGSRNHVSYLVRVKARLYWPRVSWLRPFADGVDEGQIAIALTLARGYALLAMPTDAEHAVEVLAKEVERLRALLAARSP